MRNQFFCISSAHFSNHIHRHWISYSRSCVSSATCYLSCQLSPYASASFGGGSGRNVFLTGRKRRGCKPLPARLFQTQQDSIYTQVKLGRPEELTLRSFLGSPHRTGGSWDPADVRLLRVATMHYDQILGLWGATSKEFHPTVFQTDYLLIKYGSHPDHRILIPRRIPLAVRKLDTIQTKV